MFFAHASLLRCATAKKESTRKEWTPCHHLYIRSPLNSETEGPCPRGAVCTVEDIPSRVYIFRDLPQVRAHPCYILFSYLPPLKLHSVPLQKLGCMYPMSQVQRPVRFIHLNAVLYHGKSGHYFLLRVDARGGVNVFCHSIPLLQTA